MKLDDIIAHVRDQFGPGWSAILDQAPRVHLAFLNDPFLGWILDGTKTVESRFSKVYGLPHGRIGARDVVLLKKSGGPIVGAFKVLRAEDYDRRAMGGTWDILRSQNLDAQIVADEVFWEARKDKKFATLIWIDQLRDLSPIDVDKSAGDRRPWIILRDVQPALPMTNHTWIRPTK